MSWPLPCIPLNSYINVTWLEEFLGQESKFYDLGQGIKINRNAIIFEDKLYLGFGATLKTDFKFPVL